MKVENKHKEITREVNKRLKGFKPKNINYRDTIDMDKIKQTINDVVDNAISEKDMRRMKWEKKKKGKKKKGY